MADGIRMQPPREDFPRQVRVVQTSLSGPPPSRAPVTPVTVATRPGVVATSGGSRLQPAHAQAHAQAPNAIPVHVSSVNMSAPSHVAGCPTPSRPASVSVAGACDAVPATYNRISKDGSFTNAAKYPAMSAAGTGRPSGPDGSPVEARQAPLPVVRVIHCDSATVAAGSQSATTSTSGRYRTSATPTVVGGSVVSRSPVSEAASTGDCCQSTPRILSYPSTASINGRQPDASSSVFFPPPTATAAPPVVASTVEARSDFTPASDAAYFPHPPSGLTAAASASASVLASASSERYPNAESQSFISYPAAAAAGSPSAASSTTAEGAHGAHYYTSSNNNNNNNFNTNNNNNTGGGVGGVMWGASSAYVTPAEAGYAPVGTPPTPVTFAPAHYHAGNGDGNTEKAESPDGKRPGSRLKSVMYRCPDCGEMVPSVDAALAHCNKEKCEGASAKSADSGPRLAPSGSSAAAAASAVSPTERCCTPASAAAEVDEERGMPKGEAIAYDERGRPTIVRQLDDGSGSGQTVVKNEDGSTRVFGKEAIDSLADCVKDKSSKWAEDMTAHQLRGLVHEVGQRLLEGSRLYHERLAELEELGENLNFTYFGLTADATEKDVDNAYRKLARKMHPDKNGGTEEAKRKFQQMKERYETLKKKFAADREKEGGDHDGQEEEKEAEKPKGPGLLADGEKPEPQEQRSGRGMPGSGSGSGGGGGGGGNGERTAENEKEQEKSGADGESKNDTNSKAEEEDKAAESEEQEKKKNVSISYDPKDKDSMVKTVTKMIKQLKNIDVQMEVLVKELDRVKAAVAAEQP